jgi:hypothetical protein
VVRVGHRAAGYAEFVTLALRARRRSGHAAGVVIETLDLRSPRRDRIVFGSEHGHAVFWRTSEYVQQGYFLTTAPLLCDAAGTTVWCQ